MHVPSSVPPQSPLSLRAQLTFLTALHVISAVAAAGCVDGANQASPPFPASDASSDSDAGAQLDSTLMGPEDAAPQAPDDARPARELDARGPLPAPDGAVDPSADAGAGQDAGNEACAEGWTARDDRCVPSCLPLPDAFEDVLPTTDEPPFGNTVWFDPDIITERDPTSFVDVTETGRGTRTVFDRRVNAFIDIDARLFRARFGSATEVEVRVNPEFSADEARAAAIRHATAVGRIPAFLFASLRTLTIHRGKQLYGGGNQDLLIHTEQTDDYVADGVLEEVLIHEATHTSMDGPHAAQSNWRAAQRADGRAISPYARDNPTREDLSETMGPYLAMRFRPERLTPDVIAKMEAALPNRIKYLDCLGLSMEPPD